MTLKEPPDTCEVVSPNIPSSVESLDVPESSDSNLANQVAYQHDLVTGILDKFRGKAFVGYYNGAFWGSAKTQAELILAFKTVVKDASNFYVTFVEEVKKGSEENVTAYRTDLAAGKLDLYQGRTVAYHGGKMLCTGIDDNELFMRIELERVNPDDCYITQIPATS